MGDIADMIIDGILCQECGVYMGDEVGYPRSCHSCKQSAGKPHPDEKVPCPTCKKKVKAIGLSDHMRDAHKAA